MGGAEAFREGYVAKIQNLEEGFQIHYKIWRVMTQKLDIFQNFINNSTSQIFLSVSHHLMILLQC